MNPYLVAVYNTRQILAYTPIKNIVYINLIPVLHENNRRRKKCALLYWQATENNVWNAHFFLIGRKCHSGQGLLWLHWDAATQPLEPHPARTTCSTPKIGCNGNYLEQMGRDCLCVGRKRLCSSPKKKTTQKTPYDTWLITPVNKLVLQLQGYI